MPNPDPRRTQRVEQKAARQQQRTVQQQQRVVQRQQQVQQRDERRQEQVVRRSAVPVYQNVPLTSDRAVASAGLVVRPAVNLQTGQAVKVAYDEQAGRAVAQMPAPPGLAKKMADVVEGEVFGDHGQGGRFGDWGDDWGAGEDWRNYGDYRSSFARQEPQRDDSIDAPTDFKTDADVKRAGLEVKTAIDKKTGEKVKVAVDPVSGQPVAAKPVDAQKPSAVPAVATAAALWWLLFI